jgi:molybdopterin-binding protein
MPRQSRESSYTVGEAARLLGVSLDTLRRWDRQGRIRTGRDAANRRIVPSGEVERLRRGPSENDLSARNRFRGVVREVKVEGLLAQVELEAGPFRVVSIVTREAVEELGLKRGMPATALVKATSVLLER